MQNTEFVISQIQVHVLNLYNDTWFYLEYMQIMKDIFVDFVLYSAKLSRLRMIEIAAAGESQIVQFSLKVLNITKGTKKSLHWVKIAKRNLDIFSFQSKRIGMDWSENLHLVVGSNKQS